MMFKVQSLMCYVLRVALQAFSAQRSARSVQLPHFSIALLSFLAVICTLFPVIFLSACGHKTPVRPPEWAAPEAIGDLALDIDDKKNVVVLKWGRPQEYVDGSEMDDLGGFVVLRATEEGQGKESAFMQVATIAVTDRDRFRKAKKFNYTDTQLTAGVLYRYRVQALTLDGYASALSNTVELVWKATPAAGEAPAQVPTTR